MVINRYQRLAIRIIRGILHEEWQDRPLREEELESLQETRAEDIRIIAEMIKAEFGKQDLEIKHGTNE